MLWVRKLSYGGLHQTSAFSGSSQLTKYSDGVPPDVPLNTQLDFRENPSLRLGKKHPVCGPEGQHCINVLRPYALLKFAASEIRGLNTNISKVNQNKADTLPGENWACQDVLCQLIELTFKFAARDSCKSHFVFK